MAGWVPIRIDWHRDVPTVDWCYVGEERFVDPFFDQTIERCLRRPFRMLFRRQTAIDTLADMDGDGSAGPGPAGFVFHMSRCGSTLIGQMLAADARHVVISEAGPIDAVLRSHLRDPTIDDDQRIAWLRGLLNAFGCATEAASPRPFVKFDSWSIFELPLIHRAFPDVPWIFVYRHPVEVLVSHVRERGSQMLPGVLQPEMFGLDWEAASALSLDEYAARVLGQVCAAAVDHHALGQGRLVHYEELPEYVWSDLGPLFGLACTHENVGRMQEVAKFHAKRPYEQFAHDTESKQAGASTQLRVLAEQWVDPWYQRLETLRATARSVAGCE
jgi:hypothetical protein